MVEPPRTVRVRTLDPQAKCGAGTSVERLFRVDETTKGTVTTHLARIYGKLGVGSRLAAVRLAAQSGLVSVGTPD